MSVNGRHEAKTHSSSNSLCDSALIDWPQTCLVSMLDAPQRGDILRHDREVLLAKTLGQQLFIIHQSSSIENRAKTAITKEFR